MIKVEQVWYIKYWKFNTFVPLYNPLSQERCKSCFATVALHWPQPNLDTLNVLRTLNVGLWWWEQPNLAKTHESALNAYCFKINTKAESNVDLDSVLKFISVNQRSTLGVYGLFLEKIYHKIYIAKFTRIHLQSQIWSRCPGFDRFFLRQGFFKRIQGWPYGLINKTYL
jgi:hypothetical protein